ncbi:nucleotidyltransferase [Candidatus Parcubacteria bacterium]|nr:nucleotidyltransferase [Patescibacteria group bacterium]MCG2688673.1 nucleotidyltransferase [Candidatus Parcubacteria bacterium]
MDVTEEQLARWAKPPSETEEEKCQNAVGQITDAIRAKFGNNVSIFVQGSYKNRTNVRLDSDVDIVVRHDGYFFPDVGGMSEVDKQQYWANFNVSTYTFSQFKNDIQSILINKFGATVIERKNKCIMVKGSSQRVNADVVPCFVHKRFKTPSLVETDGIEFVTDAGIHVYSFPEQHYDNGVSKNDSTSRMYKSVVRILKNVRNELVDQNTIAPETMPSFFLECLAWNVLPNTHFLKNTYAEATRAIVATVWNEMGEPEKANNYAEVSDLKWLFRDNQNRTHQQARSFMQHAWDFIGYES